MTDAEKEIALKMAIEALDEEPYDDFISRKFMLKLGATCIAKRDGSGNLIAIRAIKIRYHYCPNCGAKMQEVEK